MNGLFGGFLVEKNIISSDDLIEALDVQMKNRIPIGQLAKQQEMLSGNDLILILNAMRKPENARKLFGEVAVSLGKLTVSQVDTLIELQCGNSPPIGEILVSMKKLNRNQQIVLLKEFYMNSTADKKIG